MQVINNRGEVKNVSNGCLDGTPLSKLWLRNPAPFTPRGTLASNMTVTVSPALCMVPLYLLVSGHRERLLS